MHKYCFKKQMNNKYKFRRAVTSGGGNPGDQRRKHLVDSQGSWCSSSLFLDAAFANIYFVTVLPILNTWYILFCRQYIIFNFLFLCSLILTWGKRKIVFIWFPNPNNFTKQSPQYLYCHLRVPRAILSISLLGVIMGQFWTKVKEEMSSE